MYICKEIALLSLLLIKQLIKTQRVKKKKKNNNNNDFE